MKHFKLLTLYRLVFCLALSGEKCKSSLIKANIYVCLCKHSEFKPVMIIPYLLGTHDPFIFLVQHFQEVFDFVVQEEGKFVLHPSSIIFSFWPTGTRRSQSTALPYRDDPRIIHTPFLFPYIWPILNGLKGFLRRVPSTKIKLPSVVLQKVVANKGSSRRIVNNIKQNNNNKNKNLIEQIQSRVKMGSCTLSVQDIVLDCGVTIMNTKCLFSWRFHSVWSYCLSQEGDSGHSCWPLSKAQAYTTHLMTGHPCSEHFQCWGTPYLLGNLREFITYLLKLSALFGTSQNLRKVFLLVSRNILQLTLYFHTTTWSHVF